MQAKDRVVFATDNVANALQILVRINYDNDKQAAHNIASAAELLREAVDRLEMIP